MRGLLRSFWVYWVLARGWVGLVVWREVVNVRAEVRRRALGGMA